MAPPAAETGEWFSIVQPSIGITLIAVLAFIASYFNKKATATEGTPAGELVSKSIGAAFVDRSTADLIAKIHEDISHMRVVVEWWKNREEAEERAELLELRHAAKKKEGA